jgi:phage baseplate assembly protein W
MAIPTNQTPIGLAIPITRGSNGYFQQNFTTNNQINSNLKNFFLTKKGERPLNPDFGTSLYQVLFQNQTEDLGPIAEDVVRTEIAKWFPYLTISSVVVKTNDPDDIYTMGITITYYFNNQTSDPQTLTLRVQLPANQ